MQTIKKFLSADKLQRLFYLIASVTWTLFCWEDDLSYDKPNEIMWAIPTALFLLQVIFNNKIFWKLIFITMTIYSGFVMLLIMSGLMAHHNFSIAITSLMISFLLFSICWIFYHLEPNLAKEKIK